MLTPEQEKKLKEMVQKFGDAIADELDGKPENKALIAEVNRLRSELEKENIYVLLEVKKDPATKELVIRFHVISPKENATPKEMQEFFKLVREIKKVRKERRKLLDEADDWEDDRPEPFDGNGSDPSLN